VDFSRTCKRLAAVAAVVTFSAFQVEVPSPTSLVGGPEVGRGALTAAEALQVAQVEVDRAARSDLSNGWSPDARVTEALPVYVDGRSSLAYWECSVVDGRGDAGYVLVNADRTDLLVAECSAEAPSLHHYYAGRLGDRDFKVLRYDWFRSAAVTVDYDGATGRGRVLASRGMGEDPEEVAAAASTFRAAVAAVGCNPYLTPEAVADAYAELDAEAPGLRLGLVDQALARDKYRDITTRLQHTFPSGWHTPKWCQFKKSNGYYIGCGPVAWAITYAYWRAFKGKSRLFDGVDVTTMSQEWHSDDGVVRDCIVSLNHVCETSEQKYKGYKVGYTPPWNMEKGVQYGRNRGYGSTSHGRFHDDEFDKFDSIKNHIDADKPVILLIRDAGFGIPNHYVVIEEGCKRQKHSAGKWRNRDVKYLVNYGFGDNDGNGRKWIYVREVGINDHKVYTATSAFKVNVQ